MQFKTWKETAHEFRERILEVSAWKAYVEHTRIASYPDVEKAHEERAAVQEAWTAYENDFLLNRPSRTCIDKCYTPNEPCGVKESALLENSM